MRGALLKDIQKVKAVKEPPKLETKLTKSATNASSSNPANASIKKTGPPRPEDHGYAFDSMYITDDIIMEIFSYLDGYYISRCSATCKRWKAVTGTLENHPNPKKQKTTNYGVNLL